jgi:hypothetical protein
MKSDYAKMLEGWIPWKLLENNDGLHIEWLFIGGKEFTEPFFDDTIRSCKTLPENRKGYKIISDLSLLHDWHRAIPSHQPAAVIFHVSRCGSTLLSQLLSSDRSHVVLSEVPFFDALLRLKFRKESVTKEGINDLVKAAVDFYALNPATEQPRVFIKTDSWHLYFYEQYRQIYPDALFVILYREPLAVWESQKRQKGFHAVPGLLEPELFGFEITGELICNFDLYLAAVLESYYKKMISMVASDKKILLVNYNQGMQKIASRLYHLTGVELNNQMEELFTERSRYHAKKPNQIFSEESKNQPVPAFLTTCFALYSQLDQMRKERD